MFNKICLDGQTEHFFTTQTHIFVTVTKNNNET